MQYFIHADLDAFFASVEQLDFPQYRGKPIIVSGNPNETRTVVSTCSYEARRFGVHSAMPAMKAKKLCPNGIFVPHRMNRYREKSIEVMNILKDYSPDVQQISIDEAFVDITGTERLFGPPDEVAQKIKNRIKNDTGLTISIGLATNKYIAKIASGLVKPDGFTFVRPGCEKDFMLSLPINKIWGVGEKTLKNLFSAGLNTTQDIYNASLPILTSVLGQAGGLFLYNAVRGNVMDKFNEEAKSHSISSEETYMKDLVDAYIIETELLKLADDVYFRLIRENKCSSTVHVRIRYNDFTTFTVQETFASPFATEEQLFFAAKKVFYKKVNFSKGIRLLGVGVSNCRDADEKQEELFDFGEKKIKQVENAVIKHNLKNPTIKIKKARLLDK